MLHTRTHPTNFPTIIILHFEGLGRQIRLCRSPDGKVALTLPLTFTPAESPVWLAVSYVKPAVSSLAPLPVILALRAFPIFFNGSLAAGFPVQSIC